jgi:hypothetical protein
LDYTHAPIADQASGPGVTRREPLSPKASAGFGKALSRQRESLRKLDEPHCPMRFRRRGYATIFFWGMATVLAVLRFDRSAACDKQLKYSLK